jgi:hypothetical protein
MNLILKGLYSSYSLTEEIKNVPIEQKRDVVEDSSWNNLKNPNYNQLTGLEENIRKENKGINSDDDVFKRLRGIPTHSIIESYLNDNYGFQVWNEIRKTKFREHPLFAIERSSLSIPLKRTPFSEMNDNELIEIAFTTVMYSSKYGETIKNHFIANSGCECNHGDMGNLKGVFINLISVIEEKVKKEYQNNYPVVRLPIDVTKEIEDNVISFRLSIFHKSEMIAIGGVQQIEAEGRLRSFYKGDSIITNQGTKHLPHVLNIELKFIIKDWFGVDEEDVYKNGFATFLDREGLAALWVLQHQRGYKPFINRFEYKTNITVPFYK